MRRTLAALRAAAALMIAALVGCAVPTEPARTAPEAALSQSDLLASLGALETEGSRGLSSARTVFTLPGGGGLGAADLSRLLTAIRTGLGAYVRGRAAGGPYLVSAQKLSWIASNNGLPNSGLMWVPFTWGMSRSFPIISYQHGTEVYRACAPSRFDPDPGSVLSSPDPTGALQAYIESVVGALMASAGYIVVMPDYPGFGDSTEIHPYVHSSLGYSVSDIIAAARRKLTGRVTSNGEIFLTGYSEGGYATMAGARALQGAGVPVKAVVPCDGPYDLSGVMVDRLLTGTDVKDPALYLYTASGYHSVYGDEIDYDALFRPAYASLLKAGLFDGTHTSAEVAALSLPPQPSLMLTDYAISTLLAPGGTVFNRLAENNGWVGWVPSSPVIMVHAPADDVVPYGNALSAKAAFDAMGVSGLVRIVDVSPVPVTGEVSAHEAAYPTAMLAAFAAIEAIRNAD